MTIRYECEQCGSTLKIKDDLAGKPGKCPKCKTAFTVPDLTENPMDSSGELDQLALDRDEAKSTRKAVPADNGDFDVDAFLMSENAAETAASSKTRRSKAARGNDEDSLSGEPAGKSKSKKAKSSATSADEDEVFQIRRGEPAESTTSKSAPRSGIDDPSDAPVTSRRPPGTTATGTASSMASDLLSRSGKKGKRASWNEVDADAGEPSGYDWKELGDYLGKKIAPLVLGGIVGCWLLYKIVFASLGGKSGLPELGQVSGKVVLNGQPLAGAMVIFDPIRDPAVKDAKHKRLGTSLGMTDASGLYELTWAGDAKGAPVGTCRIQIQAPGRKDIPTNWVGITSKETRPVKSGRQVIDLDLK